MNVLVVDDHPSMIEGVRAVLTSEFSALRVCTAQTSETALALAPSQPWNLIVTDLSLPGRDGPELISEFARLAPGARILVYTMHPERQFGVRVLRAGAHGYVTKDQPIGALIDAVHKLLAGKRFISSELADDLVNALNSGVREPGDLLSDRERQVLKLIARGKTPGDIAEHLHISAKTVSTYRSRMLEKLRLSSTAELIRYAVERELS